MVNMDVIARAGALLKSKRRKTKRLRRIEVREISLVDSPAVPAATFVIAKREVSPELAQLCNIIDDIALQIENAGRRQDAISEKLDAELSRQCGEVTADNLLSHPALIGAFQRIAYKAEQNAIASQRITEKLTKASASASVDGGTHYRPGVSGRMRGGSR